ncbi:hydroxyacid dehydrogenase [Vibrio sp. S9_S30]|uniref:NAD(P)-dependent oxidoreductase n=1 Tax=Vibrio sp. S9_S30 TaxID=2720226 RepID=UPI0016819024|nr:NAD(P)-dependent oxidoreductase [Vibrio sp. S9_S30]MBD1556643.1 hydroxyacid dehydrogenase [Vibrio sp. S9_S30]
MKPTVVTTQPMLDDVQDELRQWANIVVPDDESSKELTLAVRNADAVIVRSQLPTTIFSEAPRLVIAARHGVGLDMIPVDEATNAGVLVTNVPGANANAVAEYVVSMLIRAFRNHHRVERHLSPYSTDRWFTAREHTYSGKELSSSVVGVVGLGAVGRRLHALLSAFGTRVLVHTRSQTMEGIEYLPLHEMAARCDALILTCPLNSETRHMIDEKILSAMPPHAILINVARGGVVDTPALLNALREKSIGTAVLDVFDVHPLEENNALLDSGVLFTPHLAGISMDSMLSMGRQCTYSVMQALKGETPNHLVNPKAIPKRKTRNLAHFSLP